MKTALLIFLLLLCVPFCARGGGAAPRFTANTLGGENFTNDSTKGQVLLIQFWTTWCPYCRRDAAALENIMRDFSGKGLEVLAVDVGESGETVKRYLEEHPRSCPIALTKDTNLVAEFHPRSLPTYVLIDREGNLAGRMDGGGGAAVRSLLSNAGLGDSSVSAPEVNDQPSAVPGTSHTPSPKLLVISRGRSSPPPKSLAPTVFVLKSGERMEARHYTIKAGAVTIDTPGNQRAIPLAALDLKATTAANHERGIDLKIPTSPNEIFLGI